MTLEAVKHCLLDLFVDDDNPYTETDIAYAAAILLDTLGVEIVGVSGETYEARLRI